MYFNKIIVCLFFYKIVTVSKYFWILFLNSHSCTEGCFVTWNPLVRQQLYLLWRDHFIENAIFPCEQQASTSNEGEHFHLTVACLLLARLLALVFQWCTETHPCQILEPCLHSAVQPCSGNLELVNAVQLHCCSKQRKNSKWSEVLCYYRYSTCINVKLIGSIPSV